MVDTLKILFISSLRDKMTIFWSILFPVALLLALGFIQEDPSYRMQLLGAVVAMGILFNAMYGIGFDVLLNRNSGIFTILRITPFTISKFIFLFSLSKVFVSLVTGFVTLFAGIIIFQIDFSISSILLLFPLLLLGIVCFSFLGCIIGNLAKIETQVSLFANLIAMPMLFLSHSFYTITEERKILYLLTKLNPFNYFLKSIQETLNGMYSSLGITYIILTVLGVASFLLALATFKWESHSESTKKVIKRKAFAS